VVEAGAVLLMGFRGVLWMMAFLYLVAGLTSYVGWSRNKRLSEKGDAIYK
jgi:hypothetical protein